MLIRKRGSRGILKGLSLVYENYKIPLVFPVHPRTKNKMGEFNLKLPKGVISLDPKGFFDFIKLEGNAKLILTDSGGVQEEACILQIPCVTMRDNTERPETLKIKSNILAGANPEKILEASKRMALSNKKWKNPFGDGKSSKKIVNIMLKI